MVSNFEAVIDKLGRIQVPIYFRKQENLKDGDKVKIIIEKVKK
jgi:bifunctional DNA-binding transcriptional regulator/antitoxin component of YhaV-PrlF toxin-antitoxin module